MANENRLDLIDRQALINFIDMGHLRNPLEMCFSEKSVVDMLESRPTVDAVEVVHAHWEDGCAIHNGKEVYKSIDCSHCNEIFKTDDREYWKARFKVCPFCGAKMDGGNEDAER